MSQQKILRTLSEYFLVLFMSQNIWDSTCGNLGSNKVVFVLDLKILGKIYVRLCVQWFGFE